MFQLSWYLTESFLLCVEIPFYVWSVHFAQDPNQRPWKDQSHLSRQHRDVSNLHSQLAHYRWKCSSYYGCWDYERVRKAWFRFSGHHQVAEWCSEAGDCELGRLRRERQLIQHGIKALYTSDEDESLCIMYFDFRVDIIILWLKFKRLFRPFLSCPPFHP